jgi:hypothetical protein
MVSRRTRVAVALVIFSLLAFTTVYTSPIHTGLGPGSSLSKTTPKQRHLSVKEIAWTFPVLAQLAVVSFEFGDVVPERLEAFSPGHFSGRYFNLPPPLA